MTAAAEKSLFSNIEKHDTIFQHGVVAHLGERIAGSDEVEGSSPFGSTFLWSDNFTCPFATSLVVLHFYFGCIDKARKSLNNIIIVI